MKEIIGLSQRYGALIYIDDAHGIGALGFRGRGALEECGLEMEENIIEMGTFGKAFGTFGAFVSAPKVIIELLKEKARSFVYTTAMPPSIAAATVRAIDIVDSEPERLEELRSNAGKLRDGLKVFSSHECCRTYNSGHNWQGRKCHAPL